MKTNAPGTLALMASTLLIASPTWGQVKRQEIITEIQAAFKAWEAISCSNLRFTYAGEQTSFVQEKEGGILVFFGHDDATWRRQNDAYYTSWDHKDDDKGDIYKAAIELNARDWFWSIGKAADAIDIRTAVLHLIPGTLGFYVGADPSGQSLKAFIQLDRIDRELLDLHEAGARFGYPEGGAACGQPDEPGICGMRPPSAPDAGTGATDAGTGATDAGRPADAGPPIELCIFHSNPTDPQAGAPLRWPEQPIKYWIHIPERGKLPGSPDTGVDGGPGGQDAGLRQDAGGPHRACFSDADCPGADVCRNHLCTSVPGGGSDDDGCDCGVAHPGGSGLHGSAILLLLGLLALLRRR